MRLIRRNQVTKGVQEKVLKVNIQCGELTQNCIG